MHFRNTVAAVILALSFAVGEAQHQNQPSVEAVNGLTQAGYRAGVIMDGKQFDRLGEVFTRDLYYDSSALGRDYGGTSKGIEKAREAIAEEARGRRTERLVTNLYVDKMNSPTNASVITYITKSVWDENALHDIKKTYRLFYRCDDIWVLQDGYWKMWYSIVKKMGPRVEAPYFGDREDED